MKITVYFIFSPSIALREASSLANESRLAEVSVWTTHTADRSGIEHSQDDLQSAFWAEFQAQLIYDNETDAQRDFRSRCLQLGFAGCWHVTETMSGGPAEDLLESGRDAIAFLLTRPGVTGAA